MPLRVGRQATDPSCGTVLSFAALLLAAATLLELGAAQPCNLAKAAGDCTGIKPAFADLYDAQHAVDSTLTARPPRQPYFFSARKFGDAGVVAGVLTRPYAQWCHRRQVRRALLAWRRLTSALSASL